MAVRVCPARRSASTDPSDTTTDSVARSLQAPPPRPLPRLHPMKSLQDLDIFVRTVDSGSLSATARALDLTPAAASAALKRLEAELGVALFVRSTRSLRLTQEGELFLEHCRPALAALHQVRGQLQGGRASAFEGTLQLAAPSDLGRNVLLPCL